jgi:sulfotransferase family protein
MQKQLEETDNIATIKSIITETPAIFVFGFQRSGTNLLFRLLSENLDVISYNEENTNAFNGFRLKDPETISSLIRKADRTCIFKPISESLNFLAIINRQKNSKALVIFRNPLHTVLSWVYESRSNRVEVDHSIIHNFVLDRLNDLGLSGGLSWAGLDEILNRYSGRFRSSADTPSKVCLLWVLTYTVMLQHGLSENPNVMLVCYEELVSRPANVSGAIGQWLGLELSFPANAFFSRERHYFSDVIDIQLANESLELYHDLVKLSCPVDVLFMWHVLEHLPDPTAFWLKNRNILADRAELIVQVPMYRSDYVVDAHFVFFNEQSLRMWFSRIGGNLRRVLFDEENDFVTVVGNLA